MAANSRKRIKMKNNLFVNDEMDREANSYRVAYEIFKSDEFKLLRKQAFYEYFQIANTTTKTAFDNADAVQITDCIEQWAQKKYPIAIQADIDGFVRFTGLYLNPFEIKAKSQLGYLRTEKYDILHAYFEEHIQDRISSLYTVFFSWSEKPWQNAAKSGMDFMLGEVERLFFNDFMPNAQEYQLYLRRDTGISEAGIVLFNMELDIKKRMWLALMNA